MHRHTPHPSEFQRGLLNAMSQRLGVLNQYRHVKSMISEAQTLDHIYTVNLFFSFFSLAKRNIKKVTFALGVSLQEIMAGGSDLPLLETQAFATNKASMHEL